jgi:hypothetical protein
MAAILSWWDGVELWLSGLGFVLQTIVVIPVVLALAYGIAVVLDGALGQGIRLLNRAGQRDESRAVPAASRPSGGRTGRRAAGGELDGR